MKTAGANLKVVSTLSVGYGERAHVLPWVKIFCLEKQTDHVDLAGLAKRGVKLGYTPDILSDAGGCTHYTPFCEPRKGHWQIPLELIPGLDSGRPFCYVGANGWPEWWEGVSACEERRGTVSSAFSRTNPRSG